jgi:pimeloyl-ACP methyl ester carboxylesterase
MEDEIGMNQNSNVRTGPLRRASWLDKVNAGALLAITPEYRTVKRAQSKDYGTTPTSARPAPMPLEFKNIAGVNVRYAQAGSSKNPTVILLNPLPQSIIAFAPLWERFASQFNLYAYDLPGFGGSDGGAEYMTFEAQGQFLRDFIAEFGIEKPHLVGPDIGMAAALHYVTHFPNDVASLMVGDGPGIAPSKNGSIINKAVKSGFWRLVFKVTGAGTFVHAANQICYLNYVPNPEEVSDYIASYAGRIGPVTLWFKNYPECLAKVDPKLAEIDVPVLVFWGQQDQLLLVENAHRLSERLKRNKLHVFEHCGHFSYQDKYEEFGDVVAEWVSDGYSKL